MSWKKILNFVYALFVMLCLVPMPALSQTSEPQATPYRPTVSNPAHLPVPGYLEVEMGWQSLKVKSNDDLRHSVPYLLKFAFSDQVGMLIGGDAVIVSDPNRGATTAGFGDLTPVLKFKMPLPQSTASAIGMEAGVKIPSAPGTVGTQRTDYLVNGIYSLGIDPVGIDLNLGYTWVGERLQNIGNDQISWAASVSYSLTSDWGVAGEFAGSVRSGVKPFTQFLLSTSYFVLPRLVADTGMAFGLNGASQEWTAFAGMTLLVGKIL